MSELPDGVYLRTRYEDPVTGHVRERLYDAGGEVWLVVDGERSSWAHLDPDQVEEARRAVEGIVDVADVPAPEDAHDVARMTYQWRLGDRTGRVVDAAYPSVVPPEIDALEETLASLEEAAAEPS
ncbi:hypothetical protein [Nocardioides caldifontis]|uniref:hypothetical protein n=1 Tax=Nocardioides caldifontis TaxID=2588938 RepID=UPI0011DF66C1|nr:hypothetical protein [Nocardioides caldifontis]